MDASLPTLSSSSAHPIVFLLKSSLLLELIRGSRWPLMCCSLYCLPVGESLCWNRLFLLHGRCCLPPSLCCFILVRLLQAEHQKGAVNWSLPFSADEKIFIQGNAGSHRLSPAWQSSKEASNSGAPACRQLHCLGHGCPTFWLAGPHWVKRNYLGLHVCRSLWK